MANTLLLIGIIQFSITSDLITANSNNNNNNNIISIEVLYQILPPYIYWDNGNLTGIFPTYLDVVRKGYCRALNEKNMTIAINYTELDLDQKYTSQNYTFVFPIIMDNYSEVLSSGIDEDTGILATEQLFSSKSVAVITLSSNIDFAYKFFISFINIKILLSLMTYATLTAALFIWMSENWVNDGISNYFIKGLGSSIWLSAVTMTSVGYGDIAPCTLPGRIISVLWMLMGLVIASLMTAAMTDNYMTSETIDLEGRKLAMLKNSNEARLVKESYFRKNGVSGITVLEYNTYYEMLEAVREGKAFAAVLNSDVAAYLQDEMNREEVVHLSFVKEFRLKVPVSLHTSGDINMDFNQCRTTHHEAAIRYALYRHRRELFIEHVFGDSMPKMVTDNNLIKYPTIAISLVIVFGLLFDLFKWTMKKAQKGIDSRCRYGNKNFNALTIHKNTLKTFDSELTYLRRETLLIKRSVNQVTRLLESKMYMPKEDEKYTNESLI